MALPVVIRLLAGEQLAEASAWYRKQGGDPLADRFEAAVQAAVHALSEFPRKGRLEPDTTPLYGELRSVPLGDGFSVFLIYYRTHADMIEVMALWHTSRDQSQLWRGL